jgi:hydrogenase maturation factor
MGVYPGIFAIVGLLWFIHVGFLVKKILKEAQETNRLLRESAGVKPESKAA